MLQLMGTPVVTYVVTSDNIVGAIRPSAGHHSN